MRESYCLWKCGMENNVVQWIERKPYHNNITNDDNSLLTS